MSVFARSAPLRISRTQVIASFAFSFVVCIPVWYYGLLKVPPRDGGAADPVGAARQRVNAEIVNYRVGPVMAEARHERSEDPKRLDDARDHLIDILKRHVASLDREAHLQDAAPELRAQLDAIRASLEAAKQNGVPARSSIDAAGIKARELFEAYAGPAGPPSEAKYANAPLAEDVDRLCRATRSLRDAMAILPTSKQQLDAAFVQCELACLNSRLAYIRVSEEWQAQQDGERQELVRRFMECLTTTRELTEELENTPNQDRKETLRSFKDSMSRRLSLIQSLKDRDFEGYTSGLRAASN